MTNGPAGVGGQCLRFLSGAGKMGDGRYCGCLSSCLTPLGFGSWWSLLRAPDAGGFWVQGGALLHTLQNCLTKLRVEVALGHLGHVILMQELTLVPLLAQPPQPVFAHHCLLTTNVAKWAHAPCVGR